MGTMIAPAPKPRTGPFEDQFDWDLITHDIETIDYDQEDFDGGSIVPKEIVDEAELFFRRAEQYPRRARRPFPARPRLPAPADGMGWLG